jgi:hypothetical protein
MIAPMHSQLALAVVLALPFLPQDPVRPAPATGAGATAAAQHTRADLERMGWLTGTWLLKSRDAVTEEHWRPLQGTTMLGTSHTFDDARTRFFEHLRIGLQRGTIAYIAMPGGAPGTVFPLTKLEEGLVEFENARHDHPQRIRYEKTEQGITATIEQLDGSRRQQFAFTRS